MRKQDGVYMPLHEGNWEKCLKICEFLSLTVGVVVCSCMLYCMSSGDRRQAQSERRSATHAQQQQHQKWTPETERSKFLFPSTGLYQSLNNTSISFIHLAYSALPFRVTRACLRSLKTKQKKEKKPCSAGELSLSSSLPSTKKGQWH